MALSQPQPDKKYTYEDYLTWDDDQRYELIDGVPYLMSAPNTEHQRVSMEFCIQLGSFLKGKPCEVFHAPFDVRLFGEEDQKTVVQPDIVVICDKSNLTEKGGVGAPDLAIEILSPSNQKHDLFTKFIAYRRAGVREYWIVDPENKLVTAHLLENGQYVTFLYGDEDEAPVQVLEGCVIRLADLFAE